MARKSRLNPGANAYGGLPFPAPGQEHRDAPLSRHSRLIWSVVLLVLMVGITAVVLTALFSN